MYSALKVNGRKLCDLAREGKTVERKSRRVHIFEIEILEMELPRVKMRVHCSKGTYIRTLCHDIGTSLGTGGCMESLLRTRVASFDVKDSLRLSEIEAKMQDGTLQDSVISVDQMFPEYPRLHVKKAFEALACNGNALRPEVFGNRNPHIRKPFQSLYGKRGVHRNLRVSDGFPNDETAQDVLCRGRAEWKIRHGKRTETGIRMRHREDSEDKTCNT